MANYEPKKNALVRIWDILKRYSDAEHPLTQSKICSLLKKEYGIDLKRKAVAANISRLQEIGVEVIQTSKGAYIDIRDFEDSELHMLIDGVLSSKHISAKHSKDLIERLCGLSNQYFRACVKNIYSVNDWSKTDNQELFLNIEIIDEAISQKKQVGFEYYKYDVDKKLHLSSYQYVSPYQLILHNQRYYLMGYSEYWGNMVYLRMDHIKNMEMTDKSATKLRSIKGFENGIDYKELATGRPYMYSDKAVNVTLKVSREIIDQIVDWFGEQAKISNIRDDEEHIKVVIKASPMAMEHWVMQYSNFAEVLSPQSLRDKIKDNLKTALKKY